jgi:DNA modification methylase
MNNREETLSVLEPNHISELFTEEVRELPTYNSIEQGTIFNFSLSSETNGLTHGFHRFPAKYIPQIPRWAIREFAGRNSVVYDPFMGSGTTLVECLMHDGVTGYGTDIDPLAKLISKVKTFQYSPESLLKLGQRLRDEWVDIDVELISPMPDVQNFEHWFNKDAWGSLQTLLGHINNLQCQDEEKEFFVALFSSILRWVSNADDQTQKTYVSGTRPKSPPDVRESFWKAFHKALNGIKRLNAVRKDASKVNIIEGGDASASGLPSSSVDLIVTSPPYLDSVDYMYNFMLEYFWLGSRFNIPNRVTYNKYRYQGIGAKSSKKDKQEIPNSLGNLIDVSRLSSDRKIAAGAYFSGMQKHLEEASRVLKEGAKYVLIIGNSQTKDAIIPVHDCLIQLAFEYGLHLDKAFAYRIRRHYMKFPRKGNGGIILIDWVMVLVKNSKLHCQAQRLPLPWVTLHGTDVAH